MRSLLVTVVAVGCGGKQAAPEAADPCVEKTTTLRAWLADLTAEGGTMVNTDGITLAKLDHEAPRPIAAAPVVFISPTQVTFQGRLANAADLQAALASDKATDTLFVVDAAAPWSTVAASAKAAAAANHTHITFAFAAGGKGKTTPPPPSAIDKELDEMTKPVDPSNKVAKLWAPDDPDRPPTIPERVFKACPVTELFTKIGSAETSSEKDTLIADGLPKAIAACGCKVELASVQRLVWSWYGRDRNPPMLGIGVDLASTGTSVIAAPNAPWSDASAAVVAVARAGKPIAFR